MLPLPSFDGRAVPYPGVENVRDYLSWRQADCVFFAFRALRRGAGWTLLLMCWAGHINNLYNTTFWTLVLRGGLSNVEAERELMVSLLEWQGAGWHPTIC